MSPESKKSRKPGGKNLIGKHTLCDFHTLRITILFVHGFYIDKWDDNYIKYGLFPSENDGSSHESSAQCMLNIATSVWLLQNCGVFYKRNAAFIRKSHRNFLKAARIFVQTAKIPPVISLNDSAS